MQEMNLRKINNNEKKEKKLHEAYNCTVLLVIASACINGQSFWKTWGLLYTEPGGARSRTTTTLFKSTTSKPNELMYSNITDMYNNGATNSTPLRLNTADIKTTTSFSTKFCFPPPLPTRLPAMFLLRPWRKRGEDGGDDVVERAEPRRLSPCMMQVSKWKNWNELQIIKSYKLRNPREWWGSEEELNEILFVFEVHSMEILIFNFLILRLKELTAARDFWSEARDSFCCQLEVSESDWVGVNMECATEEEEKRISIVGELKRQLC